MGFFDKVKKAVKKITPKPLRKPISKITDKTSKITRPLLQKGVPIAGALYGGAYLYGAMGGASGIWSGAKAAAGAVTSGAGTAIGAVKGFADKPLVQEIGSDLINEAGARKIEKKQRRMSRRNNPAQMQHMSPAMEVETVPVPRDVSNASNNGQQMAHMSPVMQPQTVAKPEAASQLMTPAVIIGGVSLLITLMNRN